METIQITKKKPIVKNPNKKQNKAKMSNKTNFNNNIPKIIIKKTKQKNRISKMLNIKNDAHHEYAKSLVAPYSYRGVKVPKYNMGKSMTYWRTVKRTFAPNASGEAFLYFVPMNFNASSGTNVPLLIDNTNTYSSSTGQTVAVAPQDVRPDLNLLDANIDSIRVVSCGLRLWVVDSALNLTGDILACRKQQYATATQVGSSYVVPQTTFLASYCLSNEYIEFPVKSGSGLVYNWRPVTNTDIQPQRLAGFGIGSNVEQLAVILTKIASTSTIYVEFTYNYELTPDVNGAFSTLQTDYCSSLTDPLDVITVLGADCSLFLREDRIEVGSTAHEHNVGFKAASMLKQYNVLDRSSRVKRDFLLEG
jgi:hypothetical protein